MLYSPSSCLSSLPSHTWHVRLTWIITSHVRFQSCVATFCGHFLDSPCLYLWSDSISNWWWVISQIWGAHFQVRIISSRLVGPSTLQCIIKSRELVGLKPYELATWWCVEKSTCIMVHVWSFCVSRMHASSVQGKGGLCLLSVKRVDIYWRFRDAKTVLPSCSGSWPIFTQCTSKRCWKACRS